MNDALEYAVGVLILVVVLALSIALHEIGHLVPAKRFGVKVTQYMIGFGPTIWSRRRGETEYGIKALPLGGYIRMIGMFPPGAGEDATHLRESSTGAFQTLAADARAASAAEISPEDADRVFYKLSVPKKVVVMLGGPTMNLLIAVVLLGILLVGVGDPNQRVTTTTLGVVNACVLPTGATRTTCQDGDAPTPAAEAGLLPGDEVVAFAGQPVTRWQDARDAIRDRTDEPTEMVVRRDGQEVTLSITPVQNQVAELDAAGEPVLEGSGQVRTVAAGFIGVAPVQRLEPQPVTAVPAFVGTTVARTAGIVIRLPQRMVDVAQAAFGDAERDPNGPIGLVGAGRLAGEISSIDEIQQRDRVGSLLGLLGSLNVALFVFNLVPLLPLDGGHVAGALWEGLRRRVAVLRHRPDPGPVDVAKALPVAYAVSIALVAMSVMLLYADIVRPISLRG